MELCKAEKPYTTVCAEITGIQPTNVTVTWQPTDQAQTATTAARPAGMYILQNGIPIGKPRPAPFIEGSRAALIETVEKMKNVFEKTNQSAVNEWQEWAKLAPQSDNVDDYVKNHPLDLPLQFMYEGLFNFLFIFTY